MAKKCAHLLFLLTVFSLPFANFPTFPIFGFRAQATEILAAIAVVWFLLSALSDTGSFRRGRFYFPVLLYLTALSWSTAFSREPETSLVKLAGTAYLAGLGILAYSLADKANAVRDVCRVWIFSAALVSAVAVASALLFYIDRDNMLLTYTLSHYGTLPAGNYPRIRSTFANPNMLCHFLSISWAMLLAAYDQGWLGKMSSAAIGCLIGFAAVFTLSPGIGAIFLITGIYVYRKNSGSRRRMATASLLVSIAAASAFTFATVVKPGTSSDPLSVPSARVLTWGSALETFAEDPLTGKGLGTGAADVVYEDQRLTDAHNLFLNVAAESGIPGLASVLFLGIYVLLLVNRTGCSAPIGSALYAAVVAAFFYQGLSGSFEDSRHLWVVLGIAAGVGESPVPENEDG